MTHRRTAAPSHRRTRSWTSSAGLSLVEATIILSVLSVLTAVVAPSLGDYVNEARQAQAKKDVETIGSGILQLLRDTGSRCLREVGTTDCTTTNRVDLLVSGGSDPIGVTVADIVIPDADAASGATTSFNWLPDAQAPAAGQRDDIDSQLIENDNVTPYPQVTYNGGGPRMKLGWRGAYLNGTVVSDPWGYKYQANTMFLTVATNAVDGGGNQNQEGMRETGWLRDTLVLSAGANGQVETSFGGSATGGVSAGGDDVIYVMKGGTR
jgi:type II secretory pathway pseudopilin PulG